MSEAVQTLFPVETAERETRADKSRQERIDAAFSHADARFRDEYTALVKRFAASGMPFIGQDVTDAYKRSKRLPQPREWRATGGIYQKLIRQGVIVRVGYRARNQGSPSAVYRGK